VQGSVAEIFFAVGKKGGTDSPVFGAKRQKGAPIRSVEMSHLPENQ
jgi:hypothetical protein